MDTAAATLQVIRQPPLEFATNEPMPFPVVVQLQGLELSPLDGGTSFDGGLVWGQISLASEDGQIPMAQFDPDILGAASLIVPLIRDSTTDEDDYQFTLTFEKIIFRQPGYFKLHVDVMIAVQTDRNGCLIFNAPTTIISAESRVIRANAFVLPKRTKFVVDTLFPF